MDSDPVEVIGSLLTIGDEILLGDIPNGNAHHIALQLRSRGFRLCQIITVGDREEEIAEILPHALDKSQFLIVTGGLGPTDDDRTCVAASKAFGLPLVLDSEYVRWLRPHLEKLGFKWSDELARLATLPEGAIRLGTDMAGFYLSYRNVPCYFLPGVPEEMQELLSDMVIPDLVERFPRRCSYLKHIVRVQGMFESEVNRRLRGLQVQQTGVEIGYLPQGSENWVTLLASGMSPEECLSRIREIERKVVSLLGSRFIIGYNDECLEKVIGDLLREKSWRMAAAESCTGGLLSRKITAIAGASDYFDRAFITYSNEAKKELLGVPEELLDTYGAVSEPVAIAMAQGARAQAKVDVAVAVTGIAGPSGGTPQKPVGTVFMACVTPHRHAVEKHLFRGSREQIQESAAHAALVLLWRTLTDDTHLHCH